MERARCPRCGCAPMPGEDGESDVLLHRCREAAESIYGSPLPEPVRERLELEMNAIAGNGWAKHYLIAAGMADQAHAMGYPVSTRGMIACSFVTFLCGISEVNPLPPHWSCPKCHRFEAPEAGEDCRAMGFDLPDRRCPVCGMVMWQDGDNLRPEILMGVALDREPEFALNFAPGIRRDIVRGLRERYAGEQLFRAGAFRTDRNGKPRYGVHPGGVYIVPRDVDITAITPLRACDPDDEFQLPITVRDFAELYESLKKYDILTFRDLELLHDLEARTGEGWAEICLSDRRIIEYICREGLAFLPGLLENTDMARRAIRLARPTCFSDIVRLLGLLHGTGTWRDNGEALLREGVGLRDLISCRDDVFQHLLGLGLDRAVAWRVMSNVRGGRGVSGVEEQVMRAAGVPAWYVDSCRKIGYLYPRSQMAEFATIYCRLAYYSMTYPGPYEALSAAMRRDESPANG